MDVYCVGQSTPNKILRSLIRIYRLPLVVAWRLFWSETSRSAVERTAAGSHWAEKSFCEQTRVRAKYVMTFCPFILKVLTKQFCTKEQNLIQEEWLLLFWGLNTFIMKHELVKCFLKKPLSRKVKP